MAKKPRPSPILTARGYYRLQFSFSGKQYKRGVIRNESVANVLQSRLNNLVIEYKAGLLALPHHLSLPDFLFSKVLQQTKEPDQEKFVFTLLDLITKYLSYSVPPIKSISTCKTEKVHLVRLQEFIAHRKENPTLDSINVGFFNDYKIFRYKNGIRTDTVKKELGTFQSVFQMAVEHSYSKYNVVRDVRRDKSQIPSNRFRTISESQKIIESNHYTAAEVKEIKRFVYLNPEEIKELLELAKNHWLYPILLTFAFTGIRRGELLKLMWSDVDWDRNIIQVSSQKQSQSKQETKRSIEIHPMLLGALKKKKLASGYSRWIFTNAQGDPINKDRLHDALKRLTKDTKFEGIGFHTFRHSLASNLAANGVDQRIIDSILGHQTEEMRKRYRHLFPQQQTNALSKLSY